MSSAIMLIFELIGTIAFAASGAIVALSKKMDILGVATLGVVTAVGGGVIRDLILGHTPPATFRNPLYALVAIGVSVILFIPAVRKVLFHKPRVYEISMLIMDSLGLGIFTVVGIQTAYTSEAEYNAFLLMFVGVITGVGGGVIRDLLAGNTPYILVKHFYASASIIGAAACILLWRYAGSMAAIAGGTVVTIVLRLLAARFHWSLPKSDMEEKESAQKNEEHSIN